MVSLSAHGLRSTFEPSRRGFLITMMGAGVMLGYPGRASPGRLVAPANYSSQPSGMASIPAVR